MITKSRYLLLALLYLFSLNAFGELRGKVVSIADGDTITILDSDNNQHKIRLSGIDAPEKSQAFGQASKEALSDLVFDRLVVIDWNKKDRYQRVVGKVLLNGQDVNLRQVQTGHAWHYKKYQSEQEPDDRSRYAQSQYLAQRDKRGLWQDPNPTAPWEWRKSKRQKTQ